MPILAAITHQTSHGALHELLALVPLLLAGLALYLVLLAGVTAWRLAHPPRRTYASAVARNLPGDPTELDQPAAFNDWTLRRDGVDLRGWDIQGLDPEGPAVIVTHGWGESRLAMLDRAPALRPLVSQLTLWDLPGHGESGGRCTFGAREAEDLRAVAARHDAQNQNGKLVLLGRSLGAEVTLLTAAAWPSSHPTPTLAGVVLECPYRRGVDPVISAVREAGYPTHPSTPMGVVAMSLLLGRSPAWRWRDLADCAGRIHAPLLVITGADDAICPSQNGEAIARAAPRGSYQPVPGVGHSGLWDEPERAARLAALVAGAASA